MPALSHQQRSEASWAELETAVGEEATKIAAAAEEWASCWEVWQLILAGAPPNTWSKHVGRMGQPRWAWVPISDNRNGPVKSVKAPPNADLAARALAVVQKCLGMLTRNPKCRAGASVLKQLLVSEHATLVDLTVAAGCEAMGRFYDDVYSLWQSISGPSANAE